MNTTEMTNRVQDLQRRATETARNVVGTTDKYVHENAWKTVALAALVGCIIGYFLGNRRD